MASTTVTKYGVARGQKILTDGGFDTIDPARSELAWYETNMEAVGLKPDVRLVEYDITTTIETSKPRTYVEPEPEAQAQTEGTNTDGTDTTEA